ncbi:Uncharacterised protein [Vibrio cholerae]|nr:Uncharacterised protein [Vibrio cholerae]CSA95468.1 Uncharacterised protein [Vibrio cholerae]CSB37692.1 Uncharacterised protein [Vibrio cholerae]CSB41492.1 Uncharacterised protein [Vibrio cholerae]
MGKATSFHLRTIRCLRAAKLNQMFQLTHISREVVLLKAVDGSIVQTTNARVMLQVEHAHKVLTEQLNIFQACRQTRQGDRILE